MSFKTRLEKYKRNIERVVLHKWQREIRGFDDTELWSLDFTILNFILPRLKAFRDMKNGYPVGLSKKVWGEYLDKMIASIEMRFEDDIVMCLSKEKRKEFEVGWDLFHKYFFNLWD